MTMTWKVVKFRRLRRVAVDTWGSRVRQRNGLFTSAILHVNLCVDEKKMCKVGWGNLLWEKFSVYIIDDIFSVKNLFARSLGI